MTRARRTPRRARRAAQVTCLAAGLALAGCASPADPPPVDWVELLSVPPRPGRGPAPAEAFTAERLEVRTEPTARELLEAHGYRQAALLSGPRGVWPTLPALGIPDPTYPVRRLLGLEFEPRVIFVREANAMILRSERGTIVLPIDPEQPLRFPEDGTPRQRETRRSFLRELDRDLRLLDRPPPEGVAP